MSDKIDPIDPNRPDQPAGPVDLAAQREQERRDEHETRQRMIAERTAERAAKAELARGKRRRMIRIEVAAFLLSALTVAGLLYYDTTRVADDFFALRFRFGKLIAVYEGGGRVYRIPVLDRVVMIDNGTRPLPALRRSAKSSNGTTATYEVLLTFRVVDAEKYWNRFHGADAQGAQLVTQTVESAAADAVLHTSDKDVAAPDTAAKLAAATAERANRELAESGLTVRDLRFVSLRLMQ